MDVKHYNQKPRRDAQYINPPNTLRAKVGTGGLQEQILDKAQSLLENHTVDFTPLAEIYLEKMHSGLQNARVLPDQTENEDAIAEILFPAVQLKANGAMFHYPLITRIAERFVQFMEVVERLDDESLDIGEAFYGTIKLVVNARIRGDGGEHGEQLVEELNGACMRYFEKHKSYIESKKSH